MKMRQAVKRPVFTIESAILPARVSLLVRAQEEARRNRETAFKEEALKSAVPRMQTILKARILQLKFPFEISALERWAIGIFDKELAQEAFEIVVEAINATPDAGGARYEYSREKMAIFGIRRITLH